MVLSLRTSVDLPSAAGVSMLCIAARAFGVRVEMVRSIIAFDALSMMTVIIGSVGVVPLHRPLKYQGETYQSLRIFPVLVLRKIRLMPHQST